MSSEIKICEYCGVNSIDARIISSKKHDMILCQKHYSQIDKLGYILSRTKFDRNEIVDKGDYCEVNVYDINHNVVCVSKIDHESVDLVKEYKWKLTSNGYLHTRMGNKSDSGNLVHTSIHRLIINPKNNEFVDHINRDKLDNRISNLRICTKQQNCLNIGVSSVNKSGIVGVYFSKSKNKWVHETVCNGKRVGLRSYVKKLDAIKDRLETEKKYFGEFAPQRHLFEEYGI